MIYQIEGTKMTPKGAVSFILYVEATSEKEASEKVLKDHDTILNWSITKMDTAPEQAYLSCPDCSGKIKNPLVWVNND